MNAFQANLNHVQTEAHPFCMVCSQSNPSGLGLKFTTNDDGSVSAWFQGHPALEGFQGLLHGGVIAALLDSAMTNCLFSRGVVAVTAELTVRFLSPVLIDHLAEVSAFIIRARSPLYDLQAELRQGKTLTARAQAPFVKRKSTGH